MVGGLTYPRQHTFIVAGSKDSSNSRTSTALSNDYADLNKSFEVGAMSKIVFDVLYTMGDSETDNSIEIKVDASPDGTNFYQTVNESVSGGTSTLTQREFTVTGNNGDTIEFSLPLDIFNKFLQVSFKESGVASNVGSVFCEATLSGS